jgi:hypothetical protein
MGPKKGAKSKGKEEEKVEESEYDTMDLEMLREVVPMLRQQLDKSMLDRNYVQLERVRVICLNQTDCLVYLFGSPITLPCILPFLVCGLDIYSRVHLC